VTRVRRGPIAAKDFVTIHNSFFRDPEITPADKGIGAWLMTHTEEFVFTTKQIAKANKVGEETVRNCLRRLEARGYLTRQRDRNDAGHVGDMEYFITDVVPGRNLDGENPVQAEPYLGEIEVHKKTNSNKKTKEQEVEDLVTSGDPEPEEQPGKPTDEELLVGFEEWWKLYPRKVAKGNARKAYLAKMRKMTTREGARALWQNLMVGVRRYAQEKAETEQQYIRHGASWLNGECWEDEPTRPAHSSAAPGNHANDAKWEGYDLQAELQQVWAAEGRAEQPSEQVLFGETL
jgi:DNA-binding Lrp family transcriptional regulator